MYRRTTLTRHQNHHTGTIGEAAAATAAALAARPSLPRPGRPPQSPTAQLIGHDSQTSSAHSTPSPGQRTASLSPASDMPASFGRPEYLYRGNGNITSHPLSLLTGGELQPLTPGATPITTPTMPSVMMPGISRPPPTSNPSYLGPLNQSLPPILEPSVKPDFQRSGSPHMSLSGSPHMSSAPSPHASRGSPHLSSASMGYHSPTYPTSAHEEPFFFPPPPPTSFQTHSASPEPGINYSENSLQKQFQKQPHSSYDPQSRKVSSTA